MKYRIVSYYARTHEVEAPTLEAAVKAIEAKRLNKGTNCYTEVWAMKNDSDGEQVKLFDPHGYELEAVKPPTTPTASLNFR